MIGFDPSSPELNFVVANGLASPGRARVTGLSVHYKWDVTQPFGMSGATTVYRGREPAKFTIAFDFWDPDHFKLWRLWSKCLEPPKPGIKLVVSMRHPLLAQAGVKEVGVEEVSQFEKQANGLWTCTVKCLEYRPPIPALVKPRGAIPDAAKGPVVPPQTAAEKYAAAAEARLKAAMAGGTGA